MKVLEGILTSYGLNEKEPYKPVQQVEQRYDQPQSLLENGHGEREKDPSDEVNQCRKENCPEQNMPPNI